MMMTLRRLGALAARAEGLGGMHVAVFANALDQRTVERAPSKLARRLRRKHELGMAGAF